MSQTDARIRERRGIVRRRGVQVQDGRCTEHLGERTAQQDVLDRTVFQLDGRVRRAVENRVLGVARTQRHVQRLHARHVLHQWQEDFGREFAHVVSATVRSRAGFLREEAVQVQRRRGRDQEVDIEVAMQLGVVRLDRHERVAGRHGEHLAVHRERRLLRGVFAIGVVARADRAERRDLRGIRQVEDVDRRALSQRNRIRRRTALNRRRRRNRTTGRTRPRGRADTDSRRPSWSGRGGYSQPWKS